MARTHLHRQKLRNPWKRLFLIVVALSALLCYGTTGYILVAHYSFMDAVFMTFITVSTVGYEEVRPLTVTGEIFTITVVLFGVVGFLYTLGSIIEILASGDLDEFRRVRKMNRQLSSMRDHVIVCGYGRIGQNVVRQIREAGGRCVVIDTSHERMQSEELGGDFPALEGDATDDEVLKEAGIERANSLVSCLDSDERNVYVVLTARTLNPEIYIVARSSYPMSYQKLFHAGANKVLSPYVVSGRRMAIAAMQPLVNSSMALELIGDTSDFIEEIVIPGGWEEGVKLKKLTESGGHVLMVRSHVTEERVAPEEDETVRTNDHLVVYGSPEELRKIVRTLWRDTHVSEAALETSGIVD